MQAPYVPLAVLQPTGRPARCDKNCALLCCMPSKLCVPVRTQSQERTHSGLAYNRGKAPCFPYPSWAWTWHRWLPGPVGSKTRIYIEEWPFFSTYPVCPSSPVLVALRDSSLVELETIVTIVLFSVKTARYTISYHMGGKLAVRHLTMFLQNDSICERVCPWRLIGTR